MANQGVFAYAPDIRLVVANRDGTTYDLSADVQDFSVRRAVGQVSSWSATINNKWRKYDRKLNRMARVVIMLRRISWLQVLSGYLEVVPYETVVPGAVSISGSCTLKILQNTYWNPNTHQAEVLMPGVNSITPAPNGASYQDGGAGQAIYNVLTQVCHWPSQGIHVQKIPQSFLNFATKVNQLAPDQTALDTLSNYLSAGITNGQPADGGAGSYGGTSQFNVIPFSGNPTFALPAGSGFCSAFGGPGGGAYNDMALTGEPGSIPDNQREQWGGPYYCAMRWSPVTSDSYNWWKDQRILVTAKDKPQNAVIVRPADYGPGSGGIKALAAADNKAIDLSHAAWSYLNVGNGEVTIQLVDSSNPCGPVQPSQHSQAGATGISTSAHLSIVGGITGEMVSATKKDSHGVTNGLLPGTMAFAYWLNDLCTKNNVPYVITSGWRTVSHGSSSTDNHMRGLAIDIGTVGNDQTSLNALWTLLQPYAAKGDFAELFLGGTTQTWYGSHYNPNGWLDNPHHIHAAVADPNSFEGVTVDAQGAQNIQNVAQINSTDPGAAQAVSQQPGSGGSGQRVFTPGIAATGNSPFVIDIQSFITQDDEATKLTGPRNFIDDTQLLASIQMLAQAALRQFQSAPNGDFVAWFPDKFGIWGQTPTMTIRDIEITDLSISVSDAPLATHVAVAGETAEAAIGGANSPTILDWVTTQGIVSVERPEVMKLLMGIDPSSDMPAIDSVAFLQTFGIRPLVQPIPQIRSPLWELWSALALFMEKWTAQWTVNASFTFMPELYPGMLVSIVSDRIAEQSFQLYVESVTHTGSRTGGFQTSAQLSCPTKNGKLLEFNDYGGNLSAPSTTNSPSKLRIGGLGAKFI